MKTAATPTIASEQPVAPAIPELSPKAELALLARILHREGYRDRIAGHITYRQPDGTLLVNPVRLSWDEVRAGDIMRIDQEGNVLDGPWTVTPAIGLHLELHRARHDVTVAVHNHPQWATIWADMQRVPPIYDQTSALILDDQISLYDEYEGTFVERINARRAVEGLGDADCVLLANHGVLVLAPEVALAYHRSFALEWRCRMAWHVEAGGGGVQLKPDVAQAVGARFQTRPIVGQFEAAVRREIREDPSVLDEEPLLSVGR